MTLSFRTVGSNLSTDFAAIQPGKSNLCPFQQYIKLQNCPYPSDAYAHIVIANSNPNINIYTSKPNFSPVAWPLAYHGKFAPDRR